MPPVTYADRAAFLPDADALVLSDLHLGYADDPSIAFPVDEGADVADRLAPLLDRFEPGTVVVAGDVLHQFGRVTRRTGESLRDLDSLCAGRDADLVLLVGNHDAMLDEVWDGPAHERYRLSAGESGDVLVCHGHEAPGEVNGASLVVIGHDHPAIEIEGRKRPCFLYGAGSYRGTDLLVLPAFTRLAGGIRVNQVRADGFMSPLVTETDVLRPVVYDPDAGQALEFPPLGRFRGML